MLFAFARFVILFMLIATVVYALLWFRLRNRREARLRAEWETDHEAEDLDAFLRRGHAQYTRSRHRMLVLLFYVLPFLLIATLIYRTNIQ